jgi:hypothetical protein
MIPLTNPMWGVSPPAASHNSHAFVGSSSRDRKKKIGNFEVSTDSYPYKKSSFFDKPYYIPIF